MKKFKNLLLAVAFFLPILNFATMPVTNAVNVFGECSNSNATSTDVCKEQASSGNTNPFISAIGVAITIVSIIIGVAAVIVIIISGFNMITSGGDAQKVAQARSGIMYALIGIVVAALAETIVAFVLNKVG